jgi:hypothetical protein
MPQRTSRLPRLVAVWYCLAPLLVSFVLYVSEPTQYERVLSIGVAALMFLSAALVVLAAFHPETSRPLWFAALLGSSAGAVTLFSLAALADRAVSWLLALLLAAPVLVSSAFHVYRGRRPRLPVTAH